MTTADPALSDGALLRALLQHLPDVAVGVLDRDLRYVLAEGRGPAAAGPLAAPLVGRTLRDALPRELVEHALPFFRRALEGETVGFELPYREHTYRVTAAPLPADGGEPRRIVAVMSATAPAGEVARQLQLYRQIVANSTEAIAVVDLAGRYVEQNAAHRALLGYADEDLRGRTPAMHMGEETFAAVVQALAQRGVHRGEVTSTTSGGDARRIELSAFVVRDAAGQPACYVGTKRDVTERAQTEAALAESEARFRRLAEHAPDLIYRYELRPRRRFAYVSPAALDIFGYPPDAFYADPDFPLTLVLPEDRQQAVAMLRGESLAARPTVRLRHRDGHTVWAELRRVPVRADDGTVVAIEGIARDVTERMRAEEEARRQAARWRVLAEASRSFAEHALHPAAVLPEVARQAGEALGDGCIVLLRSDDGIHLVPSGSYHQNPRLDAEFRALLEASPLRVGEGLNGRVVQTGQPLVLPRVDAQRLRAALLPEHRDVLDRIAISSLVSVPLRAHGDVMGTVCLARHEPGQPYTDDDVAFLQALADRAALALEQARLYEAEQRARRQAEAAVRARDDFLSVAAHELKTPMTTMRGMAQVTLRQLGRHGTLEPARLEHALATIDGQTVKLAKLVNQLLDVSRIQAGRLTLERGPADLTRLVEGVAAAAQARTERHTVVVDAGGPLAAVVDPLRIEQVVTNLLDNAIKYSPDGGEILLEVRRDGHGDPGAGGAARLAVRDHGIGIAPEHRRGIFDRFYQAHADSAAAGMGLGLHISKEIVELHGGTIAAEFPEDGGTRFVVTLPLEASEPPERPR